MALHKGSYTREYKCWQRMRSCCYNEKFSYFSKYGGSGVIVCDEWKEDFLKFLEDMGNMPDLCNGISMIDPKLKVFCKQNCKWDRKKSGRTPHPKIKDMKKTKKAKIKNPKAICLVLEADHIDYIRKQALQKSIQEGFFIEPCQLIREALQKAFPCPTQFDMFGDKI
jgi:hypothetical protein